MKKQYCIYICLWAIMSVTYCAKEKYADIKQNISDTTQTINIFVKEFNKADQKNNINGIANALTKFTTQLEKLNNQMENLKQNYPEFATNTNPPAELTEDMEKMAASIRQFMKVNIKLQKYSREPVIRNIMKGLPRI